MDSDFAQQLHDAAGANDVATLKQLLTSRPEAVDWGDANDEAALVSASCNGQVEAVKYLIQRGADPCRQQGFALTCACYWGHPAVVQVLLEAGADTVVREARRWHGLHAACGWGQHPKLDSVKLLLHYGANAKRVFEGKTPIEYARDAGQPEIEACLKQHLKAVGKE